jgi:hypothetical protein
MVQHCTARVAFIFILLNPPPGSRLEYPHSESDLHNTCIGENRSTSHALKEYFKIEFRKSKQLSTITKTFKSSFFSFVYIFMNYRYAVTTAWDKVSPNTWYQGPFSGYNTGMSNIVATTVLFSIFNFKC